MKTIREPARETPVVAECDVLVRGGGPAGFGAAVAAARTGADTLLLEASDCLGGMATAGMMSHGSGAIPRRSDSSPWRSWFCAGVEARHRAEVADGDAEAAVEQARKVELGAEAARLGNA